MKILVNGKFDNEKALLYFGFEDETQETKIFGKNEKKIKEVISKFRFDSKSLQKTMMEKNDLFLIGLGKKSSYNLNLLRNIISTQIKKIASDYDVIQVFLPVEFDEESQKELSQVMDLSLYRFDKYLKNKNEPKLKEVIFLTDKKLNPKAIAEGQNLSKAIQVARDLVNEPANVINPQTLSEYVKKMGKSINIEVEVMDTLAIEELNMGAFLAVGRASVNKPRLIVLRYFGNRASKEILGLVGKGLTFDSGGLSLKTSDGMLTMKGDMGGAASVIGAMKAIAEQKLKVNVIAVVAAAENSVSSNAYRPGDIISSMAGKTIEIHNTDAEGRLTLIDAVNYAIEKENVTKIVDVATLTGACVVALGNVNAGVVTNDEDFFAKLTEASKLSYEKVWQMPNDEEYKEQLKSDFADLKNVGGRGAGMVTAGLFIGEFVQGKPWLHIDIAGVNWSKSDKTYFSKGGTGFGVSTLYYLAKLHEK